MEVDDGGSPFPVAMGEDAGGAAAAGGGGGGSGGQEDPQAAQQRAELLDQAMGLISDAQTADKRDKEVLLKQVGALVGWIDFLHTAVGWLGHAVSSLSPAFVTTDGPITPTRPGARDWAAPGSLPPRRAGALAHRRVPGR